MDPQQMMQMLAMFMQQQRNQEHPLQRAFSGTPMFGGVPINVQPMFNLSGIGLPPNSAGGAAASMMMQSMLPQLMGPDFTPGQFNPSMNFGAFRQNMFQMQQRQAAMQQASRADADTYFNLITGGSSMMGINMNADQRAAARRQANDLVPIVSMLGQFAPDLVGSLHGRVGMQGLMASNLFEAGRYQFDPVSGRLGQSADTVAATTNQVFNRLYGPGADIGAMRGFRSEQAGSMYSELARRGFAQGGITSSEQTQLDALGGNQPARDAAMRSFNANRVSDTIKSMVGAVSAMRDIFGDMGRPNAPMVELINGLQALTQGGLSHMTGAQIEKSVRDTHAIANSTGMGIERMMGLAGQSAQLLDQLGGSRALAPQLARQSALFGFAFGQPGAQPTQFDALDREQATQFDNRLRAQAAVSPQAIRLAGVMRLAREFQRTGAANAGFANDTEAYALSQAIKAGQTSYSFDGSTRSIFQSDASVRQILTRAGVNANEAGMVSLANARSVQRDINEFNIQDLVRTGQPDLDGRFRFGGAYVNSLTNNLVTRGMSRADQRTRGALANTLGQELFGDFRQLMDTNPTIFSGGREGERNAAVADRLIARHGARLTAAGLDRAAVINLVSNAWNSGENFARTEGSGYESVGQLGYYQLNGRRTATGAVATQNESEAIARVQQVLSTTGQADLASRVSDYIQAQSRRGGLFSRNGSGTGGSLRDLAMTALGGVRSREVAGPLESLLARISALQGEYTSAASRFGGDPDNLRRQRDRILEEVRRLGGDVTTLMSAESLSGAIPTLSAEGRAIVRTSWREAPRSAAAPPSMTAAGRPGILTTDLADPGITSAAPGTGTSSAVATTQRVIGTLTIIDERTGTLDATGEAIDPRAVA